MIALYLIRHCQTTQLSGETTEHPRNDAALSQIGAAQAMSLAEFMTEKPIDLILTSLFRRSQETAKIIQGQRNVPAFAGMALNEYQLRDDNSGVETTEQATARSLGYLYQFAPYYEHIAVVAHNALLSTMRMRLMNLPFDTATDAFSAEGACRVLRYDWKQGDQNWREEVYFVPKSAEQTAQADRV